MSNLNAANQDCFKEAVCIEAQRIFDSCCDKDCLEDLPVHFCTGYDIDDNIRIVKCRCIDVTSVCINVEPVPFNKGFYSVDITYTFSVTIDTFTQPCGPIVSTITGTSVFNKKVILFGSEGNVKTFCSGNTSAVEGSTNECCELVSLPKVCVSAVQPISLDCKITSKCHCAPVTCEEDRNSCHKKRRGVTITIGLFSIVQMSRPVSILIPAYDYCVPHKECNTSSPESPCEMFNKIDFPTNEFFPPALDGGFTDFGCGCEDKE